MSNRSGTLFIVATPIGNLEDISPRARQVLSSVSKIAAEDTRHSSKLLNHLGIRTGMLSCHSHNESQRVAEITDILKTGNDVALISDAGTPLIQDPGFQLVQKAHQCGIRVVPIPGPSALISALSVAGMNAERFVFEGFLPEKQGARLKVLNELSDESRTLVFYEAPHRILKSVTDMAAVFGAAREACIAREISKIYETIKYAHFEELLAWLSVNAMEQKGEFVIVVRGSDAEQNPDDAEVKRILKILLQSHSVKEAATLTAQISGASKNALYKLALELTESNPAN